ncbi:uncharacterized protein N7458_000048 [Penicillium daleae]|uniref:Uncharacterized protein n=1 Tax=Penicillium daleae TaxID=63821 RepID=A0AAD6CH20_9EURO|nr:uncharacterized protein N7458_000048 [Penicillium daleae]KAJ5464362.1 hypothetical protein N7458_000048 [Penicillium daleae]
MKSPLQEEEGPTPAKLCALYDAGGGVRFSDSFAIYSIVAFPPEWATIKLDPIIIDQLERAASLVATKIPILSKLPEPPLPDLVSLPCPPRTLSQSDSRTSPCDQLPWFLIHAATYPKHCVFGRSDSLASLLVVLQRPWCILELCCCDASTIAALHDFAILALEIDGPTYSPAVTLLAHELSHRKDGHSKSSPVKSLASTTQNDPEGHDAFAMYRELSRSCLRSHNSFWIGLITACAVYLGVAFSDLTKMLGDLVDSRQHMCPANFNTLKMRSRSLSSQYIAPICRSSQPWQRSKKLALLRRHSIDVISHTEEDPQINSRLDGTDIRDLLDLYSRILERFREDLP